jgi:hypothetical protein
MPEERPLLPDDGPIRLVDRHSAAEQQPGAIVATDDHELIREWAAARGAEPATGEATASGPSTIDINDGGAGIRFNFPGARPFRPIPWSEWLVNFSRNDLMFVFECDSPGRPPTSRYRLVARAALPR